MARNIIFSLYKDILKDYKREDIENYSFFYKALEGRDGFDFYSFKQAYDSQGDMIFENELCRVNIIFKGFICNKEFRYIEFSPEANGRVGGVDLDVLISLMEKVRNLLKK